MPEAQTDVPEIAYLLQLNLVGEPSDRLRVWLRAEHGQVVGFVVQHETRVDERWYPVVRAVGGQGGERRDLFDQQVATIRQDRLPDHLTLAEALNLGLRDIINQWSTNRRDLLERGRIGGNDHNDKHDHDPRTISHIARNLDLGRHFTLKLVEDPSLFDQVPGGGTLILIPDDDPELAEDNLQGGIRLVLEGQNMTFRQVRAAEHPE